MISFVSALCKQCIPGEYECLDQNMGFCTFEGILNKIECPINTKCVKISDSIMCTKENSTSAHIEIYNSNPLRVLKRILGLARHHQLEPCGDTGKSNLDATKSDNYSEVTQSPDAIKNSLNRDQNKHYPSGNSPQEPIDNKPSYTGNDKLNEKPKNPLNPNSSGGKSSANKIITSEQLIKAMRENNFNPPAENIDAIIIETNAAFEDPDMAAMFLGQCAFESDGFVKREETGCEKNECMSMYSTGGASGKSYHGRGFIQLSHAENYKLASQDLGYGNQLWDKPERVSEDPILSARVSTWYWNTRVMKYPGVNTRNQFGLTTKAINGTVECKGQNVDKSKKRYQLYKSIAQNMGLKTLVDESGCY